MSGQERLAIEKYKQSLISNYCTTTLCKMRNLFLKIKNTEEAATIFNNILRLEPNHAEAIEGLKKCG